MGQFLVVTPASQPVDAVVRRFRNGVAAAGKLGIGVPSNVVETEWGCAAVFPRGNGSGFPIITDPRTGSWLLAVGTWFLGDDCASGEEAQLLQRYLEVGVDRLCTELDGFFTVVIGDARTREVVAVTDTVGSCHSFVREADEGATLAGSSLLLAALGPVRLDPIGCQEYLATGAVYQDRTCHEGVRKLTGGSWFRFADGRLAERRRYWQVLDLEPNLLRGEAAVEKFSDELARAARRIGRAFPRIVCDLTAGYDSRMAVSGFLSGNVPIETSVGGGPASPDVTLSTELAARAGLRHSVIARGAPLSFAEIKRVLPNTDGEADMIECADILRLHRTLSERYDISINGSFGEMGRGYCWRWLYPRVGARRPIDAAQLSTLWYVSPDVDMEIFPASQRLDLMSHFTGMIRKVNAGYERFPNTLQFEHSYLEMRGLRWQGRLATSTNRHWPCLSIFLCRPLLETMLQSSTAIRSRSLLARRMLEKTQRVLAEYPLEHGYPAMPVRWNNLHRFWPWVTYWSGRIAGKFGLITEAQPASSEGNMRLELWKDEEVRTLLDPESMRLGSLLDPAALARFLEHSRREEFRLSGEWSRLLGLEYALRALEEAGAPAG